jgi:peptidyl-prolyl cis-trans isomerase A (cyclophilin A)
MLPLLAVLVAATQAAAPAPGAAPSGPVVVMETSMGRIRIGLDKAKAPVSTENFLAYVRSGHYDGTIFHRVIPGFMAQAGGFDAMMKQKEGLRPGIKNESANGLSNLRGTISMARTSDPDSATSQFFINVVDNQKLDAQGAPGYAVFGQVLEGMEVVDRIVAVATGNRGPYGNVPLQAITIQTARVEGEAAKPKSKPKATK